MSAANIYITQSGAPTGSCTTNVQTPAFFNNGSNWGAGAAQIGPGTVVTICGTFTSAANTNIFGFNGNGASGNVVTLQFDPANAVTLQSPYFPQGTGAIACNGHQFILIDGGLNGVIQNTANGSLSGGFANSQATTGIQTVAANTEIRKISFLNLYVKTDTAVHAPNNPDGEAGIVVSGGSNILIHDNVFNGMAAGVVATSIGSGDTNNQYYNNEFTALNLGIEIAGGNVVSGNFFFYNNRYHDVQAWDDTSGQNLYHHNFIHFYDCSGGGGPTAVYIYNNYLYGNWGQTSTAGIFLEGGSCQWSASGSAYFWNNVYTVQAGVQGLDFQGSSGPTPTFMYNNTGIGPHNGANPCFGWSNGSAVPLTVENNVLQGCGQILNATGTAITTIDFQTYAFATSGNNLWQVGSASGNTLAAWQSSCTSVFGAGHGCDSNSSYSSSTLANLNTTTGAISAGFVGATAGTNLTSLCTGFLVSLCQDTTLGNTRVPVNRPSSGAWSTGAYQLSSGTSNLSLSPSSQNFGAAPINSNAAPFTFTLTNSGTASATISSITFTGANPGDFSQVNNCGSSLGASSSCTITVLFVPAASGARSATLTVTDTDASSPQTAALTGTGVSTQAFNNSSMLSLNINSPWRITRY